MVEEGIGGAYVVAEQMGPEGQGLLESAQLAFLDGWSGAMWLAAGVAIAAAVAAAVGQSGARLAYQSRSGTPQEPREIRRATILVE